MTIENLNRDDILILYWFWILKPPNILEPNLRIYTYILLCEVMKSTDPDYNPQTRIPYAFCKYRWENI